MMKRTTLAASVSVLAMLSASIASADAMADLEAAANAEGMLTTIALPHDWCGYGAVIEGFKAKYPGITVNELNPDAGSADEIEAIKANKDNTGPQAPDVIDVGLAFGPSAKDEGLIQPYKVATWDEIPDDVKDADGFWYGDYYGVMAIGVNTDLVENVPATWDDLLKPEYAQSFALTGDPRASNQAILAIMAMGVNKGAAPGADSGKMGLEFMAELNKAGNFVPVSAKAGTIAQGQTPIVAAWDYNLLAWRDSLAGNPPIEVFIPRAKTAWRVCMCRRSAPMPRTRTLQSCGWNTCTATKVSWAGWLAIATPRGSTRWLLQARSRKRCWTSCPPPKAMPRRSSRRLRRRSANKTVVTEQWDAVVGANVE